LLFGVGLRLRLAEIGQALHRCHWPWLLAINFVAVPAITLGLARVFQVPPAITTGMILLAAAPFAPVVPVFARMARADLPLAAGLTALFPLLCALLTPLICHWALRFAPEAGTARFQSGQALGVLLGTITLPLALGVAVRHFAPVATGVILRPVERVAEACGALSLAFVTVTEAPRIAQLGWRPLLAMILAGEAALLLGYWAGSASVNSRRVTALGTSNRNIALAILLALGSYAGTPVVGTVVANGLLLILLGLVHVAIWRRGGPAGTDQSSSR
jgi:BASS family bile acid:Na+ symporter